MYFHIYSTLGQIGPQPLSGGLIITKAIHFFCIRKVDLTSLAKEIEILFAQVLCSKKNYYQNDLAHAAISSFSYVSIC
jgi:hypothetical protein